ncbi:MAG: hypothetical protein K0V04_03855 [Deltaproteobacteria bacterium]|nr:hypothetical protein [Deltaproteobacteria bacterium]
MSEQTPEREDSEAGSYLDLQREVDRTFGGSWEAFLKAVLNPAEILYFVLWSHCEGKAHKIETWAKDKGLPPDWLPRFYGMLTHKGDFRPDAETSAPRQQPAPETDGPAPEAVPMLDIQGHGKPDDA